eukprot:gene354-7853_t
MTIVVAVLVVRGCSRSSQSATAATSTTNNSCHFYQQQLPTPTTAATSTNSNNCHFYQQQQPPLLPALPLLPAPTQMRVRTPANVVVLCCVCMCVHDRPQTEMQYGPQSAHLVNTTSSFPIVFAHASARFLPEQA